MGERIAIFPAGRQALHERNKYSAAIASGVTWLYGFQFELKVTAKLPGDSA